MKHRPFLISSYHITISGAIHFSATQSLFPGDNAHIVLLSKSSYRYKNIPAPMSRDINVL